MQASPSPAEEVVDLREYAAVLRRRKWLILAVTGLFTGLMGAYSFSKAPMYTAQTTVTVQPATASSTYRPDQLVSLDTEARLVRSAPVAILAKDGNGRGSDEACLVSRLTSWSRRWSSWPSRLDPLAGPVCAVYIGALLKEYAINPMNSP